MQEGLQLTARCCSCRLIAARSTGAEPSPSARTPAAAVILACGRACTEQSAVEDLPAYETTAEPSARRKFAARLFCTAVALGRASVPTWERPQRAAGSGEGLHACSGAGFVRGLTEKYDQNGSGTVLKPARKLLRNHSGANDANDARLAEPARRQNARASQGGRDGLPVLQDKCVHVRFVAAGNFWSAESSAESFLLSDSSRLPLGAQDHARGKITASCT